MINIMLNHVLIFFQFIITIFHMIDGKSWDLAVTIGQDVHFFLENQTIVASMNNPTATELSGIAYDEISHNIFLSNFHNENEIIYYKNLHSNATKINILLENIKNTSITSMTYDPSLNSLIWIDSKKKGIYKMNVNKSTPPKLIFNLTHENSISISIDLCNKKLYWINYDNNSISSVDIDGNNFKTIINKNLYEPVALTVDHTTGKLYWIDDDEGIFFKIERSNLDGSNREIFLHFKHQQPAYIAVDNNRVYWIDWLERAIWYIDKDYKSGEAPQIWYSFEKINRRADLRNLLIRNNISPIDCVSLKSIIDTQLKENDTANDKYNTLIASNEDINNNQNEFCLNDGTYNKINGTCQCKYGYGGSYCENSLCNNYCLNGVCLINSNNEAYCKCYSKYKGSRCEENVCTGYCYNSNECYTKNSKPMCKCKNSYGSRCEISNLNEMCMIYCTNQSKTLTMLNATICRCSEIHSTKENIYQYNSWINTIIPIFSVIIFILLIVIIVLSFFINKLRRRPRVKKRFLVSKTGITPLTSRPPLTNDSCEIMIENCCNMNICETPCFEPKGKKIEKKILIENMEGNNS